MRDENAFNTYIAKILKRMETPGPNFTFYMKAADKYRSGVSDFLIWRWKKTLAMENKYVREWPSDKALLLDHEFSGAQVTFLESMALAGNHSWGLVGVGKVMYAVPYLDIPQMGNWNTKIFRDLKFREFDMSDVEGLLRFMLQ